MKLLLLLAHDSRFCGAEQCIGMVTFLGLNIYTALKQYYMVVVKKTCFLF